MVGRRSTRETSEEVLGGRRKHLRNRFCFCVPNSSTFFSVLCGNGCVKMDEVGTSTVMASDPPLRVNVKNLGSLVETVYTVGCLATLHVRLRSSFHSCLISIPIACIAGDRNAGFLIGRLARRLHNWPMKTTTTTKQTRRERKIEEFQHVLNVSTESKKETNTHIRKYLCILVLILDVHTS